MSVTDPIADLLTRIRNASTAQQRFADVPLSNIKLRIVEILKEEGMIENFLVKSELPGAIRIFLKYTKQRAPVIRGLRRISRCGLRRYVRCQNIPHVFGGMGMSILSTPRGVMSDKQARKENVGGELLCYVW